MSTTTACSSRPPSPSRMRTRASRCSPIISTTTRAGPNSFYRRRAPCCPIPTGTFPLHASPANRISTITTTRNIRSATCSSTGSAPSGPSVRTRATRALDNSQRGVFGLALLPNLHDYLRYGDGGETELDSFLVDNQAEAKFLTGPLAHALLFGVDYQHQ